MRVRAAISGALAACSVWCGAQAQTEQAGFEAATLQMLDKVTARVSRLEVRPLLPSSFGNIDVMVKKCWRAPSDQRPEQAALIEVYERKPGGSQSEMIFSGWMFASSPALSALQHPVYDITLISCHF